MAVVVVACKLGFTVKFKHQPLVIPPLPPALFRTNNCHVPVAPLPLKACPIVLGPPGWALPSGVGNRKPLCGAGAGKTP
jgi:hypothetical protein